MKVLVTGAGGFVGTQLVGLLRERGRIGDAAVVFHLAAVPGGAAEADYAPGRRVNLEATLALLERLAKRREPPVVLYARSISVYGTDLPDVVTPATPLRPPLTYGAYKLACEILSADFSRRGLLDGHSICFLRMFIGEIIAACAAIYGDDRSRDGSPPPLTFKWR